MALRRIAPRAGRLMTLACYHQRRCTAVALARGQAACYHQRRWTAVALARKSKALMLGARWAKRAASRRPMGLSQPSVGVRGLQRPHLRRRNCSTCAARCLTAPPCATAKREPVRGGAVRVHADRQETACSSAARRATPANPGRQEEPIALARSLGAQPKFPPKAAPRAEAKRRGAAAPSATPSGPLRGIALSR